MIQLPTIGRDLIAGNAMEDSAVLQSRVERALGSAPMRAIRTLLDPKGLRIGRTPIVRKYLSRQHLRLMFPVQGGTVQQGTVVSIVCLYDCKAEETLYAHPMHAGPEVNPLLKHPDGPMARPKAQPGRDGDRATTRMIAHKRAIWKQFLRDSNAMGPEDASARWRQRYYWALKRLYFCTRCSFCRWGSPFFDGPEPGAPPKASTHPVSTRTWAHWPALPEAVAMVLASDIWKTEASYARRGGFSVSERPRIIREVGNGFLQLIFPTNAVLIQGGTLVSVSVVYSTLRQETVFAHSLSAGADPEIQFLLGDETLGLPPPCGDVSEARARYVTWRREAWSRFWFNELTNGIADASTRWLGGFWLALEDLLGGNDLRAFQKNRIVQFDTLRDETASDRDASSTATRLAMPGRVAISPFTSGDPTGDAAPAVPLETLQNTGRTCFAGHTAHHGFAELRAVTLTTLMVNLGRRCNQTCGHCHIDAGPHRTEEMNRETVDRVLDVLRRHSIDTLDITGGAPEMNPHFRYLVSAASKLCERVVDRCNLTILLEPDQEDLAAFLADHGVEITASLPYYQADHVDRQRGRGVFAKSIEALRMLNGFGYGVDGTGRKLNLVYNPVGTELAPRQQELEQRFKRELRDQFAIVFNRLFAMNNMPVNRFRDQLVREGWMESYMNRLVAAFNPATSEGFMCRHSLAVGWDGHLYDCDFNHAAAVRMRGGLPDHIRDFDASVLSMRAINTGAHCFGCAAGYGSSCSGALASTLRLGNVRRNGHGRTVVAAGAGDARKPI